jgi:hypothetical protein
MNLLLRAKLLTLSGVLALAGLGVAAAPAVHAGSPPQIYPIEGPGEITIEDNGGFTPGATGRLEAMTPDRSTVLETLDVKVNNCGNLIASYDSPNCPASPLYLQFYSANFPGYSQPSSAYVGDVLIVADGDLGNVTAQTRIDPMPTLTAQLAGVANGVGGCQGPVYPFGENFHPGAQVQLTLHADDNLRGGTVLDSKTVTVDQNGRIGDIPGGVPLDPHGYQGAVGVHAHEEPVWVANADIFPILQVCGGSTPGQISTPGSTRIGSGSGTTGAGQSTAPGTGGAGALGGDGPAPRVHAHE